MQNQVKTNRVKNNLLRWSTLGIALALAVILLSGCMGGGMAFPPLNGADQIERLGKDMAKIEHTSFLDYDRLLTALEQVTADIARKKQAGERLSLAESNKLLTPINDVLEGMKKELGFSDADLSNPNKDTRAHAFVLQGYFYELKQDYAKAAISYEGAVEAMSSYSSEAAYRLGVLITNKKVVSGLKGESAKTFFSSLQSLRDGKNAMVVVRDPELAGIGGGAQFNFTDGKHFDRKFDTPTLYTVNTVIAGAGRLDAIYQSDTGYDHTKYVAIDTLVKFFKQFSLSYGAFMAIIALALIVKIITIPFTTATFRNMRDMQRIQPLLKGLQERYGDDKQKLMEEQMKLYKEHKVNMFGGCLPMLIQFPILIIVWQVVNVYVYQFSTTPPILWGIELHRPDWPLLILYTVSMILTQKLTATTSADPQQRMMQQQMTYLMPIMFLFMLQYMASAFVLYWFFLNVFSSIHQYYLMQKYKQADIKKEAAVTVVAPPKVSTTTTVNLPRAARRKRGF